jgi:GMP synthase-like glutamine amidotransferase
MSELVVVEHAAIDPAALLGEWLDARGIPWRTVRTLEPAHLDTAPAIVSLGSGRAAYETEGWVPEHVAMLRAAIALSVPVLGLCFGAQALGIALGGEGRRAARPELGWIDAHAAVPELAGRWFSWHFDEVRPPAGATVLAASDVCVQAYAHGPHVGVQFHPEVTPAVVRPWMANDPASAARYAAPDLDATLDAAWPAQRDRAFALFDWWAARVLR